TSRAATNALTLLRPYKPVEIRLPHLRDFRRHDRGAVRLVGILVEVILVIVFRRIKHGEWRELGDDRLVPYFLALQLGDDFLRGGELLLRAVEDHGAILGADDAALP